MKRISSESSESKLKKVTPIGSGFPKKKILKEITEAVLTDYNYDEELVAPLEELIGIEGQQPNEDIMTLNEMADLIDKFYNKDVVRIGISTIILVS